MVPRPHLAQAATLDELPGGRAEIVFSIGNIAMLVKIGAMTVPGSFRLADEIADGIHVEIGERLSIAADPAEWIERLRNDFVPHGYDHVALGLVDPSLVESWSGRPVDGVPDLAGQLELFASSVVPARTAAS